MEGFSTESLGDRELLYGGLLDLVGENQASARRWARMVAMHERQPATGGPFPMSAREWVTLRITEVWGYDDFQARRELNLALFLAEHLPGVWAMCLSGALDHYRARTIGDQVRMRLETPEQWAAIAGRLTTYLHKDLSTLPGPEDEVVELVTCTVKKLRNKVNYEIRRLLEDEGEFERSFATRGVQTAEWDSGMGQLSIESSVDRVRLAKKRLHAAAKAKRAEGDERTVAQLMSDLAMDLLIGTETVSVPNYARPIINVTVGWETLAGLRDDPALLSGGTVIPADLARMIATREGATWYRLLTDPAGEPQVLSTKSYQPTGEIWRNVVTMHPTCVHEGCDRPAVECELDHDEPFPEGETSTVNLKPRCRRHHKAKHARARIERPELEWEFAWVS